MALEFYACDKRVKSKSKKKIGPNSYVCRSYTGEKLKWGAFCQPSPILNGDKKTSAQVFLCKLQETFKNTSLQNTSKRMLLQFRTKYLEQNGDSSKTGKDKKSLVCTFACFLAASCYCQNSISGKTTSHYAMSPS